MMGELYDAYRKYFEIVIADTLELKKTVYKIRYQVLCQEQRIPGFDQANYPDKLEKDEFDERSIHALLKHRPSGKYIGTLRLVLPDVNSPEKPFPVECYTQIDTDYLKKHNVSRLDTVEISRFLVIKEFQRRKGDYFFQELNEPKKNNPKVNDSSEGYKNRRVTANITLILMAAAVRMSIQHNKINWLSLMNPALQRLLSQSGLDSVPVGPLIECHGIRQPYFAKMLDILNKTHDEYLDVWEILTDQGTYLPVKI